MSRIDREARDAYIYAQDHKISNYKSKKPLKKTPVKVDKKIIAALMTVGVAIGAVSATQVVGTSKIVSAMSEDVKRDNIYITPTNGRITYTNTHQYVQDEQQFIADWCLDLYEQGWNENQVAIALEEMYGIKESRIPNIEGTRRSTFLGRIDEKNQSFRGNVYNENVEKGVSK